MDECGRKLPESEPAVEMPCSPVALCRNLRILALSIEIASLRRALIKW